MEADNAGMIMAARIAAPQLDGEVAFTDVKMRRYPATVSNSDGQLPGNTRYKLSENGYRISGKLKFAASLASIFKLPEGYRAMVISIR